MKGDFIMKAQEDAVIELLTGILKAVPEKSLVEAALETEEIASVFHTGMKKDYHKNVFAIISSYQQEPTLPLIDRLSLIDGILFKEETLSNNKIELPQTSERAYTLITRLADVSGKTAGLTEKAKYYFYRGIELATKTQQQVKQKRA